KISLPFSKLLQKDVDFNFDQPCELKTRLTCTPILQAPNGEYSFMVMCDTSNLTLGAKSDAKRRLIQWMLLIQEFDIEIKDKKGIKNSRESNPMPIRDEIPDEQLLLLNKITPWFVDICFIVASQLPPETSLLYKEKLKSDAKYYIWDDPYLWRLYIDRVIRRCIPNSQIISVLQFCHAAFRGGHYGSTRTARKVLDYGFYRPTIFKDAYQFISTYERC
ncbi:hypothetical protein CR513_26076, partial [Mucuna pruriens]